MKNALETDATTTNGGAGGGHGEASGNRGGKSAREGNPSAGGRVGRKRKETAQAEGVFMGYAARDRRRPEKRARDEEEAAAAAAAEARTQTATADVIGGGLPSIGLEDEGAFQLTLSVAHAQFASGRVQDALRLMDEVAERQRDVVALKYLRAHACFAAGDAKGAADAAKEVTLAYPHSAEAWALPPRRRRNPAGSKVPVRSRASHHIKPPRVQCQPGTSRPGVGHVRRVTATAGKLGPGVGGPRARVRARARLPVYGARRGRRVACASRSGEPPKNFDTRGCSRRRRCCSAREALGGDGTRAGGGCISRQGVPSARARASRQAAVRAMSRRDASRRWRRRESAVGNGA